LHQKDPFFFSPGRPAIREKKKKKKPQGRGNRIFGGPGGGGGPYYQPVGGGNIFQPCQKIEAWEKTNFPGRGEGGWEFTRGGF